MRLPFFLFLMPILFRYFLFNLTADPNERNNLFHLDLPEKTELMDLADKLKETQYMRSQDNRFHPLGAPELHHGVWLPWEIELR